MPRRVVAHTSLSRRLAVLGLALLLTWGGASAAFAQAASPYRIGVLNDGLSANHPTVEGLKAGLRELGLVDGRDVTFEMRFTEGVEAARREGARAYAKAGVDLIFTSGEEATREAIAATSTIPIVFTLVRHPVAVGIFQRMAAPEGNVTGVASLSPELAGKRLELLRTLAPTAKRVWTFHEAGDPLGEAAVANAAAAAAQLNLQLVAKQVQSREDLVRFLKEIRRGDAILALDRGPLDIPGALLNVSLDARVPAVFAASLYVGYGGLASYGSDYYAEGFQAARLVARILRGARPQELPVEGADKLDVAVNLKTASELGLTVPRKILLRADTLRR
jgi:putative tryptophan/tyrosine transport system substrate-binding protein